MYCLLSLSISDLYVSLFPWNAIQNTTCIVNDPCLFYAAQHVDGAGKVDGSVVVALPMDESSPFEGGGLTVWDGVKRNGITGKCTKDEIHYDTRCGDLALIDRYVI